MSVKGFPVVFVLWLTAVLVEFYKQASEVVFVSPPVEFLVVD